jgi:cation diffusion facilitator CzcD-associated flavoprotein CzcO
MPQPAISGEADLRRRVAEVNPAILLASLVSITRDAARIDEFAPHFTYALGIEAWTATLPQEQQRALEEWAVDVLSDEKVYQADPSAYLHVDDATFRLLAETLTGIGVEARSVPFLREQGGFVSFAPTVPRTTTPPADFRVAIVGAGMTGINMAIAAKQAGFGFIGFEKNHGVGGVWYQNRYPGVGVDTPSKYYSFSYELNPNWTHAFPPGGQYREYLDHTARKYGVLEGFHFGAEVIEIVWDEQQARWHVVYQQDGEQHSITANAVVTATGYLTAPQLPDVPGIETFTGTWFHSAEWDQDVDLSGKRVAVLGVGCTSVQIIDAIADQVCALTVFQRQPHWVVRGANKVELTESERWFLANVPTFAAWARLHTFMPLSDDNYPTFRYDPEWAATHELSVSERNHRALQGALAHLEASFSDRPDLLASMKPDYQMMGKRLVRDPGGYYAALTKDTTTLVTSGARQVVPEGIVDGDGVLHEFDVIVYATGFSLAYLSDWTITGRNGEKLSEKWRETPSAYNACLVPGFPNLFITSGPNATSGHGAAHTFTTEAQTHYIIECLQAIVEAGATQLEATPQALERWQAEVSELMIDSVWNRIRRATTYWRNAKGDVLIASPMKIEDYWGRLREPDLRDVVLR